MFKHFFISKTGKAIQVDNHMEFVRKATCGNPDENTLKKMKEVGVHNTSPIRNLTCANANNFVKANDLIRLSWFEDQVSIISYIPMSKVFDIVKHFGEQYGFKYGYELTFENGNNSKYFTILWQNFLESMDEKSSMLVRLSKMDIDKELTGICARIAASKIDSVQSELKRHEDHIFEDLEKNVLDPDRTLKNFKAWVYRDDDFKTPYLDELKGSNKVAITTVENILSKYSPAFSKLSKDGKLAEVKTFFNSFKTLPIEDVKIESDGDFDKDIKFVQANWVLSNAGLEVRVNEKNLTRVIEGLDW